METGPRFKDNKKTTEGILTHMQDFTIAALIWGKRISACGQATSPFFFEEPASLSLGHRKTGSSTLSTSAVKEV